MLNRQKKTCGGGKKEDFKQRDRGTKISQQLEGQTNLSHRRPQDLCEETKTELIITQSETAQRLHH